MAIVGFLLVALMFFAYQAVTSKGGDMNGASVAMWAGLVVPASIVVAVIVGTGIFRSATLPTHKEDAADCTRNEGEVADDKWKT